MNKIEWIKLEIQKPEAEWDAEVKKLILEPLRLKKAERLVRESLVASVWRDNDCKVTPTAAMLRMDERTCRRILKTYKAKLSMDPAFLEEQRKFILSLVESDVRGLAKMGSKLWDLVDEIIEQLLDDVREGALAARDLSTLLPRALNGALMLSSRQAEETKGRDTGAMSNKELADQIRQNQALLNVLGKKMLVVGGPEQVEPPEA